MSRQKSVVISIITLLVVCIGVTIYLSVGSGKEYYTQIVDFGHGVVKEEDGEDYSYTQMCYSTNSKEVLTFRTGKNERFPIGTTLKLVVKLGKGVVKYEEVEDVPKNIKLNLEEIENTTGNN